MHFSSVDSTNDFASQLLAKMDPLHGTVISSDFQRSGRGQFGKKWLSETGENLLMSLILRPSSISADRAFALNMICCLAVCNTLNSIDPNVNPRIKWPNDILVKDKKIAGILVKSNLFQQMVQSAVCGIGININQREFPETNSAFTPVSMFNLTNEHIELTTAFSILIDWMDFWLEKWKNAPKMVEAQFLQKTWGFGGRILIDHKSKSTPLSGSLISINATGKAEIKTSTGVEELYINDWKITGKETD